MVQPLHHDRCARAESLVSFESTLVDQTRSSLRGQLDALAEVPPDSRGRAVAAMDDETYAQLVPAGGKPGAHRFANVTDLIGGIHPAKALNQAASG